MGNREIKSKLIKSIRSSAGLQNEDGSFPAGHNGPYHDPETPVRNTSHWVIGNLYAWKYTGDDGFRNTAERGVDYLVDAVRESGRYGVVCRNKQGKDKTNGLMGQAWVIEALAEAAWMLDDEKALNAAEDLFYRHDFDDAANAWLTAPQPGSGTVKFDRTFNHQLWFAASGALLVRCGVDARARIKRFVGQHVACIKQYRSGLIHHSNPYFRSIGKKERLMSVLRHMSVILNGRKVYLKSVGYHTFNTYALALLEKSMPDLGIRNMDSAKKAVSFVESAEYVERIGDSEYSFAYNPPGFEGAYTLKILSDESDPFAYPLMKAQVDLTYNAETGHFDKSVSDANTCAARVYEGARLLEPGIQ